MKAEIKKQVFDDFHKKFTVGLLICTDLDNQGHLKEIDSLLDEIENLIKTSFSPITIKTHDLITIWEVAAEGFSGKKHYCSSIETMMKKIIGGDKIKKENRLRDLCNFISLKYLLPVDCFDLGLMEGDLSFELKGNDIVFTQGGYKLSEKLAMKRNKKFEITDKTKEAVVYLEALPPLTEAKLKPIMTELADLIRTFCKGKVKLFFLDKKNPEVKI
ncbi:MAG: hypothetical protein KAT77_01210 [Nanoarchaeota archaeon]|nr:hypothetical protein [Nanoarchaeota archaeon]